MKDTGDIFPEGFGGYAAGGFNGRDNEPAALHPLVLAYIGDSVYEVYIRSMLAQSVCGSVHKIHTEATKYARCAAQADVVHGISDVLTEREHDIVRRGRNAHSGYVPKNANVIEYRYATGFEALLGYLFVNRDFDRLNHILSLAVKKVSERSTPNAE